MMQTDIKIAISDDFLKAFAGIPRDRQQAVIQFLSKFRHNPTSAGINYEKIRDAADDGMRSVRIDQNYRGIVLKPAQGNVYCLLWIDKHDEAYEWARRHRISIHPELGSIQVFEAHQYAAEAAPAQAAPDALFAGLKDRELVRLGVPEEALPIVRSTRDEADLDRLQSGLPTEAYEALFMYAAGESYDDLIRERETPTTVDTADFAVALDRDVTRRHFVVLTDDQDLEALLASPLAAWRVFLHPSQRKLINRDWNGPVRVLGGAGTGKTVVAMHRAVWLARHFKDSPGTPVLFTTFTRTLADDIRAQLAEIATPAERARIEVVNIDQWALNLLRRYGWRPTPLYDEGRRRELWRRALTRAPDTLQQAESFYRAEFERVVLPAGCQSADDYVQTPRTGRGVPLSRAQKRDIWPVFAEYRAQLLAANLREPEEAFRDAVTRLRQEPLALGIKAIVVDEAQDLSAAALELLRAAVPEGANDLFVVGDAHQRIYRHKVVLSRVGIRITGRSRRLRINYRTTDEIRRWAVAQLANCTIDDLDGQPDTLMGYKSLTHGEAPLLLTSESRAEERKALLDALTKLDASGVARRNTCLVVRRNEDVNEYADWLRSEGFDVLVLTREVGDDDERAGMRIATMHRVKGLEFDAVVVAGYVGAERYADMFAGDGDAGVLVDTLTSERSLLHVAATRAKYALVVSTLST
jgi:hypothetical protein